MSLTAIRVKAAKSGNKPYKLFDGKGLFVLVHPNNGKYWRLKYYFERKEKVLALGVYPEVSLAKARARRDAARVQLADGIDPSAQRQARKPALTTGDNFEAVARAWMAHQDVAEITASRILAEWID